MGTYFSFIFFHQYKVSIFLANQFSFICELFSFIFIFNMHFLFLFFFFGGGGYLGMVVLRNEVQYR